MPFNICTIGAVLCGKQLDAHITAAVRSSAKLTSLDAMYHIIGSKQFSFSPRVSFNAQLMTCVGNFQLTFESH